MVTIAILGLGARGGNVYSSFLKQETDRCTVTAICDINREKVEKYQKIWGLSNEQCFYDENELLKVKRADGIIIATDDKAHFNSTMKALELGYDILIEKPVSPDPLECLMIAKKAKEVNKQVIVAHVLRYAPFFNTVKNLISSDRIGKIIDLAQTENVGFWHYAHSFVRGNWNNDKTSSPIILAKCCHDLDMTNYLLGENCISLSSIGGLSHFTKENKPERAPKRCTDGCPHAESCEYNAIKVYLKNKIENNNGWLSQYISVEQDNESLTNGIKNGPYGICVYQCDNNVADHQTVSMQYENGITATLNMNAFSKDCFREIRVSGTKGEIIGNDRDNIITVNTWDGKTEVIDINKEYPCMTGHGNGDIILTNNFINLLAKKENRVENIDKIISSHINAYAAEKSRLQGGKKIVIKEYVNELLEGGKAERIKMKDKWLYEKFVAHRGLHGGEIKQNTMRAFEEAVKHGYNIELDVQLSKDKVPVIFHDLNLEGLTGCKENVRDLTFEELKQVKYKDSDSGIPSFKEVLELCDGKSGLMIEIKKLSLEDRSTDVEDIILPMLKNYKGDFIVKSFNPYSVDYFREKAPEFTRGFLSDALLLEDYPESIREIVKELVSETKRKVDFIDFGANRMEISEFFKSVTKMPVIVWTVRSQQAYEKIKDKVDNIIFENFIPHK